MLEGIATPRSQALSKTHAMDLPRVQRKSAFRRFNFGGIMSGKYWSNAAWPA
jgi:hypothetical protein